MASIKHHDSSVYLSPQHSPALGFGSPALSQNAGWSAPLASQAPPQQYSRTVHSASPSLRGRQYHSTSTLPSPPQRHKSTFVPTQVNYQTRGSPLSPPSSDGLMTPPNNSQEFDGKIPIDPGLPEIWAVPGSYQIKADDGLPMHMTQSNAPSPPTLFIEDILREETSHQMHGMSHSYLDDSAYNPHHQIDSGSIKRERSTPSYTMSALYPTSHTSPSSSVSPPRTRKKRQLTEASDANFQCQKCGKFFSRIWNYNAHLETHDPDRPRPHICPHKDCEKAFVRRTDLTRHTQCVHARDKKFRCELCNNMFARKDTLRRHEDDGCPKRVDIVSKSAKNRPFNWQSQALSFYSAAATVRPAVDQAQPFYSSVLRPTSDCSYDQSGTQQMRYAAEQIPPSGLPPLSDIVQRGW